MQLGKRSGKEYWKLGQGKARISAHWPSGRRKIPGALADEIRIATPPTEQPLTEGMSAEQGNSLDDGSAARKGAERLAEECRPEVEHMLAEERGEVTAI